MSIGTVLRTDGVEGNPFLTPSQRAVALMQQQRTMEAAKRGGVEVRERERRS